MSFLSAFRHRHILSENLEFGKRKVAPEGEKSNLRIIPNFMRTFQEFCEAQGRDPNEEKWSGSKYGRTEERLKKVKMGVPTKSVRKTSLGGGKRGRRSQTASDEKYHGDPQQSKKK